MVPVRKQAHDWSIRVGISHDFNAESLSPETQALQQPPVPAGTFMYAFPGDTPAPEVDPLQDQVVCRPKRKPRFNIQF